MENAVDTRHGFMAQQASQDLAERPLRDIASGTILARDGLEVPYDSSKLIASINRANDEAPGNARLSQEQIGQIEHEVHANVIESENPIGAREIQDMVIMGIGRMKNYYVQKIYTDHVVMDHATKADKPYIPKMPDPDMDMFIASLDESAKILESRMLEKQSLPYMSTQRDFMFEQISKDMGTKSLPHDIAPENPYGPYDYAHQAILNNELSQEQVHYLEHNRLQEGTIRTVVDAFKAGVEVDEIKPFTLYETGHLDDRISYINQLIDALNKGLDSEQVCTFSDPQIPFEARETMIDAMARMQDTIDEQAKTIDELQGMLDRYNDRPDLEHEGYGDQDR